MKKYFEIEHEQTVVAQYKYPKNGAQIRVYEVNPPWGISDSLMFHLKPGDGNGEPLAFRFRPDEGIKICNLILEAIYKTTTSYEYTPTKDQPEMNKVKTIRRKGANGTEYDAVDINDLDKKLSKKKNIRRP